MYSIRLRENVLPKEAEEMKRQEVQRARKVREDREAAERVEADRKAGDASMWREVEDYKRYTLTTGMDNKLFPGCENFSVKLRPKW